MSLIYGILMFLGGIILTFTGEMYFAILMFFIGGMCIVGWDVFTGALPTKSKSPKRDFTVTNDSLKDMRKIMEVIEKMDNLDNNDK